MCDSNRNLLGWTLQALYWVFRRIHSTGSLAQTGEAQWRNFAKRTSHPLAQSPSFREMDAKVLSVPRQTLCRYLQYHQSDWLGVQAVQNSRYWKTTLTDYRCLARVNRERTQRDAGWRRHAKKRDWHVLVFKSAINQPRRSQLPYRTRKKAPHCQPQLLPRDAHGLTRQD